MGVKAFKSLKVRGGTSFNLRFKKTRFAKYPRGACPNIFFFFERGALLDQNKK